MPRHPHKSEAAENTPVKWKVPSSLSGSHHCLIATQEGILIESRWSLADFRQWVIAQIQRNRKKRKPRKTRPRHFLLQLGMFMFPRWKQSRAGEPLNWGGDVFLSSSLGSEACRERGWHIPGLPFVYSQVWKEQELSPLTPARHFVQLRQNLQPMQSCSGSASPTELWAAQTHPLFSLNQAHSSHSKSPGLCEDYGFVKPMWSLFFGMGWGGIFYV